MSLHSFLTDFSVIINYNNEDNGGKWSGKSFQALYCLVLVTNKCQPDIMDAFPQAQSESTIAGEDGYDGDNEYSGGEHEGGEGNDGEDSEGDDDENDEPNVQTD